MKQKKINIDYKMFTNIINIIVIKSNYIGLICASYTYLHILLGLLSYLISMGSRNNSINFNQL